MKRIIRRIILAFCVLFSVQMIVSGATLIRRNHLFVRTEAEVFEESARILKNPDCGFYRIYRFFIDEKQEINSRLLEEMFAGDEETTLAQIQINLQSYRDGRISNEGLDQIRNLFEGLKAVDKRLIVRFLYDWEGKNEQYEPESLSIILGHMEQLEPILRDYKEQIYLIHGIFIGNWGEMNGSAYLSEEDMRQLTKKLASVTDESTYLSVRTPAQWRAVTQIEDPQKETIAAHPFAWRLSLYNDGMLGSESDYGTYALESGEGRSRQEELAFQDLLCDSVPNGGEVIVDNPYNDFENAVTDLAAMHVSYLNMDYDWDVLEKWKQITVTDSGCYDGMDGYTYIEQHLGSRFYIEEAALHYSVFRDNLSVEITLKNGGFAPVYQAYELELFLCTPDGVTVRACELPQDIRELTGGNESETALVCHQVLHLSGLPSGEYQLFFAIRNPVSGVSLELANNQEMDELGYFIGTVQISCI